MNGALWTASPQWPLATKLTQSNFPSAPIARLETLPTTDIAWFNPGRHPAQGVIAVSSTTAEAIGSSMSTSGDAVGNSGTATISAISLAGDSTGNALQKSYRKTIHALGISAQHVGDALHITPNTDQKPE
jgi:hypothetical protein